jgi:hypothetical protein
MTAGPDAKELARQCRALRTVARRGDPERLALAIEDLAEQLERMDRKPPPKSPTHWRAAS